MVSVCSRRFLPLGSWLADSLFPSASYHVAINYSGKTDKKIVAANVARRQLVKLRGWAADPAGGEHFELRWGGDWLPQQTPKGRQEITYSSYRGNAEVFRMNPDGSGQVNLTRHPAGDYPSQQR